MIQLKLITFLTWLSSPKEREVCPTLFPLTSVCIKRPFCTFSRIVITLLLDQWSSKWESGPPWGLQLHFRGFVKSWVQPSWNLVLCTFNVTSSHEIITLRTQSYPIFPVLVQLCQWGMHCILWWGGSHKDLFKIREHPSPYLEASLWMHQCWKVVFGGGRRTA